MTLFKESKPAWPGPVTLPHTLSAAMINVIRSRKLAECESPLVIDPFCGTGTCLFDAAIRIPNARILGMDRNPASPVLVRDNLTFLSSSVAQLKDLSNLLTQFKSDASRSEIQPVRRRRTADAGADEARSKIVSFAQAIGGGGRTATGEHGGSQRQTRDIFENGFSSEIINQLRAGNLSENLIFYLTWRAMASVMNVGSLGDGNLLRAVLDQAGKFEAPLRRLWTLKASSSQPIGEGPFSVTEGGWGKQSIIGDEAWRQLQELDSNQFARRESHEIGSRDNIVVTHVNDSVEALEKFHNDVDVIIGDPPYWFNTDSISPFDAQAFYGRFIDVAVRALRPGGKLGVYPLGIRD